MNLFRYKLQTFAIADSSSEHPFISIQDYFNMTRATHTEKSQVAYLEALSDSKDTLLELVHDLFANFIKDQTREYLVVEGDQKLYEVLQSLTFEYGRGLGNSHSRRLAYYADESPISNNETLL